MLHRKISLLVLPLVTTLSLQANDPFFNDPFGDDIFKEMMIMQQDMDKMFNQMHQRIQQRSTNIISPLGTYKISQQETFIDKGTYYEYLSNIPENKENQIDINVKNNAMTITAKIIHREENKGTNSFSSSSSMRMYQQSLPLPADADEGSLKAVYKNGKLVMSLKKLKTTTSSANANIRIHTSRSQTKEENKTAVSTTTVPENNSTKEEPTLVSKIVDSNSSNNTIIKIDPILPTQ